MNLGETIWTDPASRRSIQLAYRPSATVIALLSRTIWGGREMRYRILDLDGKLFQLRDPYVFSLLEGQRLASVCILDRCKKMVIGQPHDAFHVVLAATDPSFRQQGLAGILLGEVRRFCEGNLKRPGLAFAFIEASTKFSLNLSERICHTVEASMPLVLFSRLRPSADDRVRPGTAKDRDELVSRLSALYDGHDMTDFEASVTPQKTFILSENGKMHAAAQVEVLNWSFVSLPGVKGRLLLTLLPWVPFLKKLVNPRNLRFVRFGNVLVKPGHELHLISLLETVLARHRVALGLLVMDARSPVLEQILAFGRLGFLSSAVNGAIEMHLDFVGQDQAAIEKIKRRPKLMGAADVF